MKTQRSRAAHELVADILMGFELLVLVLKAKRVSALGNWILEEWEGRHGAFHTDALGDHLRIFPQGPDEIDFEAYADDFVRQMVFCRMVDSFTTYLSEILFCIGQRRPEALCNAAQERPMSAEQLRAAADQRVDRLSRGSSGDLLTFFRDALGIQAFDGEAHAERVELAIALRSLHVHHRGRIHSRFAKRWRVSRHAIGRPFDLPDDLLRKTASDLLAAGTRIDRQAVDDFGVEPFSY